MVTLRLLRNVTDLFFRTVNIIGIGATWWHNWHNLELKCHLVVEFRTNLSFIYVSFSTKPVYGSTLSGNMQLLSPGNVINATLLMPHKPG